MKKYIIIIIGISGVLFLTTSCKKYLDILPDDVATLDNAFATRSEAKKFLFTCYSYMPKNGNINDDPAMQGGDEIWRIAYRRNGYTDMARGLQSKVSPIGDKWGTLYKALRDCHIFLANIDKVPDMDEIEKKQWIAEVNFLIAYYHFYLVKMYGPIPLIKKNLPIDASPDEVQVSRDPVDSCFKYIVQVIDKAIPDLPLVSYDPVQENGRITQVIAYAFKAKVLVYAASPLFNGNTDEAGLKNPDGTQLFNQTFSKAKWDSAAVACEKAIEVCESAGLKLYDYRDQNGSSYNQYHLSDTILTQLSIRNSMCEKWNSGIIWANTQSFSGVQAIALPMMDVTHPENHLPRGELSPPLKIAEMFYTEHGVPIDEDKTWDYGGRDNLRTADSTYALYIRRGYTTASLNFDRGPRFYADLGFDGSVWYGQGLYDDSRPSDLFYVQAKFGQIDALQFDRGSITGYFIKKFIHFQNVIEAGASYAIHNYPWPMMQLSGLYLLYAEALNESQGPGPEVYHYLNLIRERAGLPSVQSAWDQYSINPNEYKTQKGLRDIIHRERLIELAFEGQRFWDLRRWKEAAQMLNTPIQGWDGHQKDAKDYYRPVTLFNQTFGTKDYFWPIKDGEITANKNLVQNLGW
jgi:hypothetical protein